MGHNRALSATGALNREAIAALILGQPPLLTGCPNWEQQLQPNGCDLTLRSLAAFRPTNAPGRLGVANADRQLPELPDARFDADGWATLTPGPWRVTFNEIVNLPRWLMALGRPRSSLLRAGVALNTAVWDAGYHGRSQALLVVHHPAGFRVQRDAAIAQLAFFPLSAPDAVGYTGAYQGENR